MGKNEKQEPKESPAKAALKKESDLLAGRIYRLRILQGKPANWETIERYRREEEALLPKLQKIEEQLAKA